MDASSRRARHDRGPARRLPEPLVAPQAGARGRLGESAGKQQRRSVCDFDALDFGSNYRQFMAANVPDSVRNLALQKLWSSSDIISQPDELDD
jgi:hypothetical protein